MTQETQSDSRPDYSNIVIGCVSMLLLPFPVFLICDVLIFGLYILGGLMCSTQNSCWGLGYLLGMLSANLFVLLLILVILSLLPVIIGIILLILIFIARYNSN